MQTIKHQSAPACRAARRLPIATAIACAIGFSTLAIASPAQARSVIDAATNCPQPDTIIRNAYPAATKDPNQDAPAGYLLADRKLMLPTATPGTAPFMFCKVWPANDKLLLVGVPSMYASEPLDQDREGDLDILVVDRATLKTQERLTVPNAMSDDAIRLESMEFDTARYVVAPGVQAFGVRASYNGASRPNPFAEVTLRLFTMKNGNSGPLRMVLDGLSVSRMNGEWDTNCKGEFTEYKAVLAMTPDMHNGMYAIKATKSTEHSMTTLVQGGSDCTKKVWKDGKTPHTLTFDGTRYVVPDALKAL